MIVLGLHAFGHDAAAVLLVDGRPVFAASEERYDRHRHSAAFPEGAIEAALGVAGIRREDVDVVAFPWTRGMARTRKLWHVVRGLPSTLAFLREPPDDVVPGRVAYLRSMRTLEATLARRGFQAAARRVPHHEAHATAAALALPEGTGAVLTADGMGEWTTAAAWAAVGGTVRRLRAAAYPHSPGKTYAALTQWLGFRPESDEGKTMGLAAYGDPDAPVARSARRLMTADRRRILRVDLDRLDFPVGRRRLYGKRLLDDLGPARGPGEALVQRHRDAARGIQDAVEDVFSQAAEGVLAEAGCRALGLAGGLFLNCALNGRLHEVLGGDVHPFPVAGDAGAAWGAAAHAHRQHTGRGAERLTTLRLGHDIRDAEARAAVDAPRLELGALAEAVADRLRDGELVAVARGRAEFGPRALGGRSILARATSLATRDRLNAHKGREAWRPLAPVIREEEARLFSSLAPSPAMILTFRATPEGRDRIPGGIHADGTARVQTVGRDDDPFLRTLLAALEARGEVAAFLNTSLNRPGEPIANTAAEALVAARAMRLDAIVVGDRLQAL